MEFCELSEQEYNKFIKTHPLLSSYQVLGWGKLKKDYGWINHLVGIKNNNKVIAATLLLQKPTPIKRSIFYAPRGFLIDFEDEKILKFFIDNIKEYIKKHKGFMLKIDPNYIYQMRNNNGIPFGEKKDNVINNLKKLGFTHLGFNKGFETMQPRFLCRFKLAKNYNDTINSFSKSTKKHIQNIEDSGVNVRLGTIDDIDIFEKMLKCTASRNKMVVRPSSYYKKMFNYLNEYSKLFIAYIDTRKFLNIIEDKIEKEKINHAKIAEKMKNEKVGKNLKNQLDLSNKKSLKLIEEKKYAQELCKTNKIINIGALYSIFINDEAITFMSGTDDKYRKFNPKYALYNAHIKEALKDNFKYVNFYGIMGDFDKQSPNYGIYELKKGFNVEVLELIGEFDLIINKFYFLLYKISFNIYHKLKK